MQVVCPFASCLKDFNNLRHFPLKTQCGHSICRECAISNFEKFGKIVCPICKTISKTSPNEMKKDKEVLISLKREEEFRKQAHSTFDNYCSLNCKFLEVKRNVEKSISRATIRVQRLLNYHFNQCAAQTLGEINEGVEVSEKRKDQMEEIISKMEKTKISGMLSEENIQGMIDVQDLQFKLNSNLQEAQILQNFLEDTTESIIAAIEGLVRQERLDSQMIGPATQNITEGFISQIELANPIPFTSIQPEKPQPKRYSTIMGYTNNKITFNIDQKTFTNQALQMPATGGCCTYIEQIDEAKLIISGLNQENDYKQFIKYDNGDIQRLEMIGERSMHRTIFNLKELDFIISGVEGFEWTEKCEVYNFTKNNFTNIKDIPDPISAFGCSFLQEQVLTFGVLNEFDCTDLIQSYNPNKNAWVQLQHKIPAPYIACSAYLRDLNSCLVYSKKFESQMFDFNSISRHGEAFKGDQYVFTNAINSNNAVYQFDQNTVLYCYELNNAKWEKIE